MSSQSNTPVLVLARFLLASPFLVSCVTTFTFLSRSESEGMALEQTAPIVHALGELGRQLPQEKVAVLLAVVQGLGGFLMVFNHKFGGLLLVTYLVPVTLLTCHFWSEDAGDLPAQLDLLGKFLKNLAVLGGVLAFMATTDEAPLKVKRKPHQD